MKFKKLAMVMMMRMEDDEDGWFDGGTRKITLQLMVTWNTTADANTEMRLNGDSFLMVMKTKRWKDNNSCDKFNFLVLGTAINFNLLEV